MHCQYLKLTDEPQGLAVGCFDPNLPSQKILPRASSPPKNGIMTINDSSKRQILWSLLVATFVGTMLRNPAARAANDPCFFVARTGIKWINDPSAEKGFAFFDNGTYVEFWDSRLVNEF